MGGTILDLGGLAASLFMRGIAFVPCPTTLLAQVDAAVGGKTAINLRQGKNLAGTFHQPLQVLTDTDTLSTLPDSELRSGLGEVVKTALVGDPQLLVLLEESAAALELEVLEEIVLRCVRVKGGIVAADEREAGRRAELNLGHTFGHAIEHSAGYGRVPHGEAVATGVVLAVEAARQLGLLEDLELGPRLVRLLERLSLGSSLKAMRETHGVELATADLLRAVRHDKKGVSRTPRFVVPRAAGNLCSGQTIDPGLLEQLFA